MELTGKALFLASLVALTTACGSFNDSTNDRYSELKKQKTIPGRDEDVIVIRATPTPAPEIQQEIEGALIDIKTVGSLAFMEGDAAEFGVYAKIVQLNMAHELVFSGLPEGAIAQKQVIDGRQVYKVKWTPPAGFAGSAESKSHKFEVEVKLASQLSEADQDLFERQTRKESFELLVSRTRENPTVQKVSGLDGVINEGTKVSFVVEVRDPGAQSTTAPTVTIKRDNSATQETVGIDGSAQISLDPSKAPVSTAPGIWNFFFVYDTETQPAPRPSRLGEGNKKLAADEIPVRFKIEIVSPSTRSTSTSKEFRLKYNTDGQAPQFTLLSGDSMNANLGELNVFNFKVSSAISGSLIRVKQQEAQTLLNETLPGGSSKNALRCANNGTAEVTCELKWRVPCDEALVGTKHKLVLKASNSVAALAIESIIEKEITVVKTNECTAEPNPTAGGN